MDHTEYQYAVIGLDDDHYEAISLQLMNRLYNLEVTKVISESWSDSIMKYGLLYEVTRTSGLTLSDIEDVDDETFLNRVNYAMAEWDI